MKWKGKINFDGRPQYATDGLITSAEVDTISGSLQNNIDGKSDIAHFHDDRYYTESEVDTISGTLQTNIDGVVSDTVYSSDWNEVTDKSPSKNTVYDKMETKADKGINADITSMTGLDDDGIPLAKVANAIGNIIEDTTPQLGGQLEVGEFDIKFDSLLSADAKYSGFTCDGVLGATLSFGDLVYLNTSDQRWELADASAEATAGDVMLAMVTASGIDGDTRLLFLQGFIREDDWSFISYGQALYIGLTAGDIVQDISAYTTGNIVRVIGHASTFADQIYFNPSGSWLEIT